MIRAESPEWLALLRAPGLGPSRLAKLLGRFGSPAAILDALPAELSESGLSETTIAYLQAPDWRSVEKDLGWLQQPDNHLVRLDDPEYPPLLRQTQRPPTVLFVHGDPGVLSRPQIAIVGTRHPTASGRETAREFAAHLAQFGLVVTSGLARGVDGEAHEGALQAGATSVAVMGTGLNSIYPACHAALAHRIAEMGALVSELPPDTPVLAKNFPSRNRIISGLSLGVLVVEAALRSGSLITARLAAEQGREVFAIPGSIHSPMAKGCHALIRQGAKLVETGDDVLEELGPLALAAATLEQQSATGSDEASRDLPALDLEYQMMLEQIGCDPVSVDALVQRCGLTAEVVSSMLLILELQGHVAAEPGGRYSRIEPRCRA
jgi:DNA processing protein